MNVLYVFLFTFGDSLFACLQVLNLVAGRKRAAFFTSLGITFCKISAVLLVVKATTPLTIIAYMLGGTIGAQVSLMIRRQT